MSEGKRVRGVKASRSKLEKALLNAGIRSQAELAQLIAEREGLATPPKDLVSRTFRQNNVSHNTIARIAQILDVAPHTLYLTQNEVEAVKAKDNVIDNESGSAMDSPTQETIGKPVFNPAEKNKYLYKLAKRYIAMAVLLGVGLIAIFWPGQDDQSEIPPLLAKESHRQVMIIPPAEPVFEALLIKLEEDLQSNYKVATDAMTQLATATSPIDIPEEFGVDYAFDIEVIERGLFKGVVIYVYTKTTKTLLTSYADVTYSDAPENIAHISESTLEEFNRYVAINNYSSTYFNKQALINYLASKENLAKGLSEINVSRALELVHLVLDEYPNSDIANAHLCNLYAQKVYLSSDPTYFERADSACQKAASIAPDAAETHFAFGQLMRRQNSISEAITHYKQAIGSQPSFVQPRLGLTESYIKQFLQTQDGSYLELAKKTISEAEALQPNNWQVPFISARISFFSGDTSTAIQKFEQSLSLEKTLNTLGNIGSLYFCTGDIDKAYAKYKQLEEEFGPSPMSDHLLASTSFYNQRYQESIDYNLRSLERQEMSNSEGLYQTWINLGEAYLANNQLSKAKQAYSNAITQAELSGQTGDVNVRAEQLYARMSLLKLEGTMNEKQRREFAATLSEIEEKVVEPGAMLRLMLIHREMNNTGKADILLKKISAQCKAYADHPSFAELQSGHKKRGS
jgi:tetratricopeptide (TPR) repeat protein